MWVWRMTPRVPAGLLRPWKINIRNGSWRVEEEMGRGCKNTDPSEQGPVVSWTPHLVLAYVIISRSKSGGAVVAWCGVSVRSEMASQ